MEEVDAGERGFAIGRIDDLLVRRRRALLGSWPRQVAAALEDHARWLAGGRSDGGATPRVEEKDWLLLPGWLAEALLSGRLEDRRRRELVDDVLWSQYCLYLAVRVEDDLFDGQAGERLLVTAPRLLRAEAERALSRHLGRDSRFWRILRRYHEETVGAILEVDARQRQPGALNAGMLEAYARASRILTTGSAAICVAAERLDLLAPIEAFADAMAIADQILDDLADLGEDLASGRWSYAANVLLEPRAGPSRAGDVSVAGLERSVVFGDAIGKLLARCREQVERARAATIDLPIPDVAEHLDRLARRVAAAAGQAHGWRVELFLARRSGTKPESRSTR